MQIFARIFQILPNKKQKMTHVTTSPILCDRCKSPMPVTANLHDDVWVNLILPATVNNVYMLQCLRAVNRKSLDAVDAKVSQLANVIQSHASHKVPVPISLYVSTDELSNSDKAKQAISDWILLFCVANNRMRRKASSKAFIADMHNKLLMNYLTGRLIGKLVRSLHEINDLKTLVRKAHAHKWDMELDKEKAIEGRDAWIDMTAQKIVRLLPEDCNRQSCESSVTKLLRHGIYTISHIEEREMILSKKSQGQQ
tara:strand:- start:288 stop:1049 length:762 start_codon:yes stop_codon:yes gene_type:complete